MQRWVVVSLDQTQSEERMLVPTSQMLKRKESKREILIQVVGLLKYLILK